jgi:L-iditol 2-dehydrogenase
MLAVVKTKGGPGNVELMEVDKPTISDREVLLEVEYCGICGTDLHVRRDTFRNYPPVILGHEFVGRVVAKGSRVGNEVDDRTHYAVLGAIAVQCGKCRYCRNGYFMFCPERRGMGHGVNGAFARYARVRPDQLFALTQLTPVIEGAMVEPMAVAVAVVTENSIVRPGDVALLTGPGPIGLLCLQMLVRAGVQTIVAGIGADAKRLEMAAQLGALRTVNVEKEDLDSIVRSLTGGDGVDAAYEISGNGDAVQACLKALRPLGSYTQVGHFGKSIDVPYDLICFKQLKVFGSVGYTRETWRHTLRLLDQGMKPSAIVSHQMPMSDWKSGFDLFEHKQATKVILVPDEH